MGVSALYHLARGLTDCVLLEKNERDGRLHLASAGNVPTFSTLLGRS